MSLTKDLLYRPPELSTASKYTVINGVIYLAAGVLLIAWPGATQTFLMDRNLSGTRKGSSVSLDCRSWSSAGFTYLGGRTGGRQVVAASVIDRLIFVPIVLLPLAFTGVFPRWLVALTIIDVSLAIGAWVLFGRTA